MNEAFRLRLDQKLAAFREWACGLKVNGCKLVQYLGVECISSKDISLADVEAEIEGLVCEGFGVEWEQHAGLIYLRVWEDADLTPPWPTVFAEEHLADVEAILAEINLKSPPSAE